MVNGGQWVWRTQAETQPGRLLTEECSRSLPSPSGYGGGGGGGGGVVKTPPNRPVSRRVGGKRERGREVCTSGSPGCKERVRRCCGVAERRVPRAVIHNVESVSGSSGQRRGSLHSISAAVLFLAWC